MTADGLQVSSFDAYIQTSVTDTDDFKQTRRNSRGAQCSNNYREALSSHVIQYIRSQLSSTIKVQNASTVYASSPSLGKTRDYTDGLFIISGQDARKWIASCLQPGDLAHNIALKPQSNGPAVIQWLAHWPLMGGLLHLVQRWGDWARPRSPPRPLLAVPKPTHKRPVNQLRIIRCSTIIVFAV